ncbi:MAG: FAD binding domain-containing protein [Xanthobacteraceae bacterium]|jgi:CO/xanthine dehydrogenase FAD-binding subunit
MKLPPFAYACPTSVSEAVALLAAHDGEAKALAGGQSLVPMLAFRVAARRCWSICASFRSCSKSRSAKMG